MRATIEAQLSAQLEPRLVKELLDAHAEAKRNFYLGGLRLSAVEGGRFCEAAFRLLEYVSKSKKFTPLGRSLDTEKIIRECAALSGGAFSDSIRLHIPRGLRMVYDIRNKRDAAHLGDGIDPNLQDATLVIAALDWVLAEFLRLYHNVSANDALAIVNSIVERVAPVIQDFNGFLKVLNPALGPSDHCLVLLYQRGSVGAKYEELHQWVRPKMRSNLRRTLRNLCDRDDLVHFDGMLYRITQRGERDVEARHLIEPGQLT
jgi:hypothetical protein